MLRESRSAVETSAVAVHRLACHEVWGGQRQRAHLVELPGLHVWVYSAPIELGESGGDIHYISACERGALCRVVLADVSGHGRAVSAVARNVLGLMRRHIDSGEQRQFMHELSDSLGRGEASSATFATAVALGIESETGRLVFTNAGHPAPLWYRAARQR